MSVIFRRRNTMKMKHVIKIIAGLAAMWTAAIGMAQTAETNAPVAAPSTTYYWTYETNVVSGLLIARIRQPDDPTNWASIPHNMEDVYKEPHKFVYGFSMQVTSNLVAETVFDGQTNSVVVKKVPVRTFTRRHHFQLVQDGDE